MTAQRTSADAPAGTGRPGNTSHQHTGWRQGYFRTPAGALTAAAWPLAVFTILHRVFLNPQNDHPTDDFTTVWDALHRFLDGVPVYDENYHFVDPHYLYSPGGTLLLSPLALLPSWDVGRILFILANGVAVFLALAVLTKMARRPLSGPVLPVAALVVFGTESVTNTLLFSNVNGILLLVEVVFLWCLLVGSGDLSRRLGPGSASRSTTATVLAGVVLGLAITVKPQFAVLLFLPLVKRQWWAIVSGLAVPVIFNLIAWPLMTRPSDYVSKLMPYLGEVRDYANSSLSGVGVYFGMDDWFVLVLRGLFSLGVAVAVLGLVRWRDSDPMMWASTTTGILMTGVFLVSSLGQMYYSMMLLPMIFTVFCRLSVMHNPVIWIGVYWCMAGDSWYSDRWEWPGRIVEYTRGTVGWGVIILTAATSVVVWLITDWRRRDRGGAAATTPAVAESDTTAPGTTQEHQPEQR
ncbi:glycosyltransferase family 87 protein [Corynebacterium sp. USCH3]|uniref:glycosyltransferase family 87 protein n=1 Tax=Corynebacterium sp. USCH3 TaxID=3024840 RepID=UPI0030A44983